jgi:hypothetical protein
MKFRDMMPPVPPNKSILMPDPIQAHTMVCGPVHLQSLPAAVPNSVWIVVPFSEHFVQGASAAHRNPKVGPQ